MILSSQKVGANNVQVKRTQKHLKQAIRQKKVSKQARYITRYK